MKFQTVNPATEEIIADYETMPPDEVFAIADLSHAAFLEWRELGVAERAPYLVALAAVLRDNLEKWARLITVEMGKTISESRSEIEKCAWMAEMYAERTEGWLQDELVEADGLRHIVTFEPLGVIFSIMPWNYPFWQALRFAVPGIVAGNTSLLKHASNVTGCALAIEEAFELAGFPANVFRTIVPDYATASELIANDVIAGVSLTGSTQVGAKIGETAGGNLKKVVLELDGPPHLDLHRRAGQPLLFGAVKIIRVLKRDHRIRPSRHRRAGHDANGRPRLNPRPGDIARGHVAGDLEGNRRLRGRSRHVPGPQGVTIHGRIVKRRDFDI